MTFGAGMIAVKNAGAKAIIDPRPFAVGSIKATFEKYSHLENVLPAMGYGDKQVEELEKTINASDSDVVVSGTPIDLKRILRNVSKPIVRVRYDLQVNGEPSLDDVLRGL